MLSSKPIIFNTPKTKPPQKPDKRQRSERLEPKRTHPKTDTSQSDQNSSRPTSKEESNEKLKNKLDNESADQNQGAISPTEPGYVPNLVKVEREEQARETEKLDHLVDKTNKVLCKVSAIPPFDLFPDELVIALNKITLIRRSFFGSESVTAIATDELSDVSEESIPFFTALRLKPQGKDPVLIKFLPNKEGKEAGKILHGIVECNKAKINILKLDAEDATQKIIQLGETQA